MVTFLLVQMQPPCYAASAAPFGQTWKTIHVFATGDDDTIFFVDAAMDLVKDLDPEMPYFLTGMIES